MEDFSAVPQGTVEPEVRAFVTSLVTAIGGTGSYEDGRYVLGDDALACLRDLKRWLRLYDEKLNRLDVARVLAERNLVKGDLLEILAAWPEDATEDRIKSKIALACFELLVPLTWPLEKNEEQATANHYRNLPYLQLAQISYKREVLEHASSGILRAAIRAALPSLALSSEERTQRDEGILKLILYFFRNIAMVSAPANLPVEWNENEVSRSATIETFQQQDVFSMLLTIASNIGEDFGNQDTVLLEILFHLFKGVDVHKLFLDEVQLEARHSNELKDEMLREASMLRGHAKTAPTRHNRFGTMIWVKRDEGRGVSCVSGQDVLTDAQSTLKKMDQSKKYNRPVRRTKEENSSNNFGMPTHLTNSATQHLRAFVEEFLDSGFNPLMYHLRKAIEREADRVLEVHSHQFFYLTAWCLEAERARRKCQREAAARKGATADPDSFGLVASVLNQETFILLNRYMEDRYEHKLWLDLNAGMRSFIQILLTVQEMADSPLDEDQEIADNIQNRIFYEETTHDRILSILKGFKDQGFSYLDACTELAHVFLRLLERYSKQNLDLQVRSRHRSRKKQKKDAPRTEGEDGAGPDSEAEEIAEAQRTIRERKFDFGRFAAKFATQSSVDTFTAFLTFYNDLTPVQLKRAHRFFHRVAFKQDMSVLLFRMDILHLLYQMMTGPTALEKSNSTFSDWHEFAKQVFRRFTKKMQERPALAIEVLFSKINSTAYYLEYGYEKQTTSSRPRAPAELEVKGTLSREDQLGVVVAVLHEEHADIVGFVRTSLESAADVRQSWEAEAAARREAADEGAEDAVAPSIPIRTPTEGLRLALFKNAKFRLLLSLSGCQAPLDPSDPAGIWTIPSSLTSNQLRATAALIAVHAQDPKLNWATTAEEEAIAPEQLLRRKPTPAAAGISKRTGAAGIDWGDSEIEDFLASESEDHGQLGPTPRVPDALSELKKARRKRKRRASSGSSEDEGGELDEAMLKARRRARLLKDLEKQRKIKSSEFVRDSDDESDAEHDAAFFEAEEGRRRDQTRKMSVELEARRAEDEEARDVRPMKKKPADLSEDDSDDAVESTPKKRVRLSRSASADETGALSRAKRAISLSSASDSDSEPESDSDTGLALDAQRHARSSGAAGSDEDHADTPPSSQSPRLDAASAEAADGAQRADKPLAEVAGNQQRAHVDGGKNVVMADVGDEEDEDEDVMARPTGRRRLAVLDDTDDE